MPTTAHLTIAVIICAATTFGLRAIPFAVARQLRQQPLGDNLRRWMPAGSVVILAIYCLVGIRGTTTTHGLAEFSAATAVVAVHLWKRNMVLSIMTGTVICVALANAL